MEVKSESLTVDKLAEIELLNGVPMEESSSASGLKETSPDPSGRKLESVASGPFAKVDSMRTAEVSQSYSSSSSSSTECVGSTGIISSSLQALLLHAVLAKGNKLGSHLESSTFSPSMKQNTLRVIVPPPHFLEHELQGP